MTTIDITAAFQSDTILQDLIQQVISRVADNIDGMEVDAPMEYSVVNLNITGLTERPDEEIRFLADIYSEV